MRPTLAPATNGPLTLDTHPLSNALLGGPLYRSVLAGRLRLPCILTLAIAM